MDRKSFTGYAFVMNGADLSWELQKQQTVALSSTEAEYMALAKAAKAYLKMMLGELKLPAFDEFVVLCNNCGVKCMAENPVFHGGMKRIDVRHHFVHQVVVDGILLLKSIPTTVMPAAYS